MKSNEAPAEVRTSKFSRNKNLESLLIELNSKLWISEKEILAKQSNPKFPLILVMGPLRSGSTLFMQWLANTGLFAYPTNILSRFYGAPILGAQIQLLLTDPRFNFRDELGEFLHQQSYQSENGKTKGVLAPNEFWYFWRRFLAEPDRDAWSDDELRQSMDAKTLMAELAGMMDVFQKPLAAKGMLFNYNIPFLDALFDKILFIQLQRDPVTNVASALEARRRQLGSEAAWYSFKIPEYDQLQGLDPVSQTAGQIHYINQAITIGLRKVDESRKIVIDYERFCAAPRYVFDELCRKLDYDGIEYSGPKRFQIARSGRSSGRQAILEALQVFKGGAQISD